MSRDDEYKQYLQSETWAIIRRQRLAVDDGECALCSRKAKHVHHKRYPNKLGTETVKDLVSLCEVCHKKHHGNDRSNTEEFIEGKNLSPYERRRIAETRAIARTGRVDSE
jgi:5-methylcytosine-specific restriction endonuclease McrA